MRDLASATSTVYIHTILCCGLWALWTIRSLTYRFVKSTQLLHHTLPTWAACVQTHMMKSAMWSVEHGDVQTRSHMKGTCHLIQLIVLWMQTNWTICVSATISLTCKNYTSLYILVNDLSVYQVRQTVEVQKQLQHAHVLICLAGAFSVVCSVL